MAREFAKQFYNSKKWKNAREFKIAAQHGICERCGKSYSSRQLIVHHKIYLTPQNICDENISLNQDNLECVCKFCHNEEHLKDTNRIIYFDENGNVLNVYERN